MIPPLPLQTQIKLQFSILYNLAKGITAYERINLDLKDRKNRPEMMIY